MGDDSSQFQFSISGVELEISGERSFVEAMYQRVMRDVENARSVEPSIDASEPEPVPRRTRTPRADEPVTWVHRCDQMMRKIYMSSPRELRRSRVLRVVNLERINVIYAHGDTVFDVLPGLEQGQTLWAELTEAGRQKIAQAQPEDSVVEVDDGT